MFSLYAFQYGATAFLIAFAAAAAFTIGFKVLYQWITPYHEHTLIREGNMAAAVTLGGALIGYVLPLASALSNTVSLPEFAAWALLAGGIQILVFLVVSRLALKDLKTRIEAGEMAPAIYMASISICAGLLNAACMTA
jgi:putative membrane protein